MGKYEITISERGDSTSSGQMTMGESAALDLFERDKATLSQGMTITLWEFENSDWNRLRYFTAN